MNTKKNLITLVCIVAISVVYFLFATDKATPHQVIKQPETQTASTTITIISFGDSLTAGYGVALSESYPSILEKKLNESGISATVLNMGVSGETSEIALERLEFVLKQNPDFILLGLGANDMLRSLPPKNTYKNLETMILFFKKNNKKIVLLGMKSSATNGRTYRNSFDAIYPDLSKKYSLPLVSFFLQGVALDKSLNINDGIHPNYGGYQKIVDENILPALLPYLKQ